MLVNPNLQQRLENLPKRMSDPKPWIHGLQKKGTKIRLNKQNSRIFVPL